MKVPPGPDGHPRRFGNVDALRALAAILVIWAHAAESFVQVAQGGAGRWMHDWAATVNFGRIGVTAFFCVSGFVIPATLSGSGWPAARRFLVNRFFRLFPLYWLSVACAVAVLFWLPGRAISPGDIALNLTMMPQALGATPAEGLYWTLEVELLFYALCLLLFCLGRLADRRVVGCLAFGGLAVMLLFLCQQVASVDLRIGLGHKKAMLFANLSLMFFGALCRSAAEGAWPWRAARRDIALYAALWIVAMAGTAALVGGRPHPPDTWNFYAPYPIALCLFLACVFVFKRAPRWLAWLGLISYSLYLWHPMAFALLQSALAATGEPLWLSQHLAVYLGATAALTVLVSWLTYETVERPAIAFGRRLAGAAPP